MQISVKDKVLISGRSQERVRDAGQSELWVLVTVTSNGIFQVAGDVEFVRSSGRQDPILWDVCILFVLDLFERIANAVAKSRCRRQFSRYTCPRCNLLYCSLPCFRAEVWQVLSF
jgi:hypothetical protein